MDSMISHNLKDLGFFSAIGTTEHSGMEAKGQEHPVKSGTPKTFDYNNGTYVVYDEQGRPWIVSSLSDIQRANLQELIATHELQHGAYVPHSNDSGHFVREVMPKLMLAINKDLSMG